MIKLCDQLENQKFGMLPVNALSEIKSQINSEETRKLQAVPMIHAKTDEYPSNSNSNPFPSGSGFPRKRFYSSINDMSIAQENVNR